MRRRVNIRFLLCLLAGLFLLGGGVHLLHAFQADCNLGALFRQAERANREGNPEEAFDYLDRYLAQRPNDLDALAEYGQTLDRVDSSRAGRLQVLQVFEQVLEARPDQAALRRRAAELAMLLNRLPDAVRHLEALLQAHGANRGQAAFDLARCHEAQGAFPKAEHWYRQAAHFAPANLEAYVGLAQMFRERLNQPDAAAKVLDEMVAANPGSPRAYLARANLFRQDGKGDQADRDTRMAQELKPDDPDVVLAVARMERGHGDGGAAEKTLRRGLRLHPEDPALCRALADLYREAKRPAEAAACLRQAVKAGPKGKALLPQLADLLAEAGDPAEAGRAIAELARAGLPDALADFFRARLREREGKWADAAALLEKAAAGLEPYWAGRARAELSRCAERLHDPDRQLRAARQAFALSATPENRLALAAALLAGGQAADALRELADLTRSPRPPEGAWTAFARAALLRSLQLPRGQAEWDEVERAAARAEKEDGDSADLVLIRAECLAAQQNLEAAAALVAKRRDGHPGEVKLWVAQSELAERGKETDEALRLLGEAEKQVGDRVELRAARVRYWGRHPGADAGPALKRLEQGADHMSADDRAHLLDELAAVWYRAGDVREAERLWREQARLQPDNLRPRLALLDLALQGGDDSALVPLVREICRLEGEEGPLWRYGEAARLVLRARSGDRSGLAAARRLWSDLNKRSGGSAQLALLAADLDELEGQPGRAVEDYQLAVELGERRPEIVRKLAELLVARRRHAEADRALRRLEEQGPLGRELARLGADVAVRLNDPERAVELARRAVPGETRDYRDQVWLGRVLAAAGRPREAEDVLRRCAEKFPGQAEPWVALAEVRARDGQWARAEAVAAEVCKCVDPERQPLALARVYEAADRCDLAGQQYQDAAASRPDDFLLLRQAAAYHLRMDQPVRAEPYLRRLLELQTGAPEEDAALARRRLALALAGEEGAPRRDEALALLDLNLARRPNSLADVRARTLVVAGRPNQRREGLRQFQATLKDLPAGPDELLVSARLYEADGDGAKAREQRVSLLALDGRNPQYLAHQVRGLLHGGERGEAAVYLARLEQVQPRAARTRELGKLLRQGN